MGRHPQSGALISKPQSGALFTKSDLANTENVHMDSCNHDLSNYVCHYQYYQYYTHQISSLLFVYTDPHDHYMPPNESIKSNELFQMPIHGHQLPADLFHMDTIDLAIPEKVSYVSSQDFQCD